MRVCVVFGRRSLHVSILDGTMYTRVHTCRRTSIKVPNFTNSLLKKVFANTLVPLWNVCSTSFFCPLLILQHYNTRWCSWMRHCATTRNVVGSIPYSIIGIFHWINPSGRTMALGSIQPHIEMSTRNISWEVQPAGACRWQSYHFHVLIVLKSGSLNCLEPSGSVQSCITFW